MSEREMSVANQFYPGSPGEVERFIEHFNALLPEQKTQQYKVNALISPHAGYVYSGFTANAAFHLVEPSEIKRVVVIGPSHRVYLKGASIALQETYATPYKSLKIDTAFSKRLEESHDFLHFNPSAHREHSTETQMPLIAHYFHDVSVVEIVYGDIDFSDLVPLMERVMEDKENFLVISTDLSHFHSLKEANYLDDKCLQAVASMQMNGFETGCEACGKTGVKAVIQAALNQGLKTRLVDYRTSYDASEDDQSVVGYMSALIGEENELPPKY